MAPLISPTFISAGDSRADRSRLNAGPSDGTARLAESLTAKNKDSHAGFHSFGRLVDSFRWPHSSGRSLFSNEPADGVAFRPSQNCFREIISSYLTYRQPEIDLRASLATDQSRQRCSASPGCKSRYV